MDTKNVNLEGLLRDEGYEVPVRCSKCGKMLRYLGVGEYKCDACGFTEYDDYGLVRAYLEKHPGATAAQVEKATGVSQKTISLLVRQSKIEAKGGRMILEGGTYEKGKK
ncbi:MAG: hypothetical protein K5679_03410 [Lachnospiraceae bacterium]|nr:hypothetical protein [Lachnospiraceae bacterium]